MNDFDAFYIGTLALPVLFIGSLILLYKNKSKFNLKKSVRLLFWNTLLTLTLLSIVFLVGETHYRFYVDTTNSFGLNKISQRWEKRYYQKNNRGLRDNIDYQYDIPKGKRRISIIGDSFTVGHGIKDPNDRFGNLMRKKYKDLEVHLIATSGASTLTEAKILKDLQKDGYQFDIVVLAYCLNDIDYIIDEAPKIYKRIHDFNNNLGFIAKNSYFINMLSFQLFALNDPDFMNYADFVLDSYSGETWEKHKTVLKDVKDFTDNINHPLMVVTFPFLQQEKEKYTFRAVHQQLNNFWKENNVVHLDLLPIFEPHMGSKVTVNEYDAHPNEFAHQLAADAIDNFFRQEPPQ